MRVIRSLFLPLLLVVLLTAGLRFIHSGPAAAPDYAAGNAGAEVLISITNGESGSDIAKSLFDAGVVKSIDVFFRLAVADERAARIAPGDHLLERNIPAKTALNQLLDNKRIAGLIIIKDGARLAEVITSLVAAGYGKAEVKTALKNLELPLGVKPGNPEGFLYPANYSFVKETQIEEVLRKMLETFNFNTAPIDFTDVVVGYTGYELLVIGSLIQAEADAQDYRKVSRVIYNRLKIRMPLQLDTTVQYLLQRRGEITLAIKDTKIRSKYNTYQNYGLPPAPIGNPTLAALEAALNPELGDWLYFITVKPGDTRFTKSNDEFLRWKAEYKRNVSAGLFKVKP